MTTLLTKTLKDGRTLTVTYSGDRCAMIAQINGKHVGTGAIDRRSTSAGAARMSKLPAEIAGILAGVIGLTAQDLAAIDTAAEASIYGTMARATVAKVLADVATEMAIDRQMAIVACPAR